MPKKTVELMEGSVEYETKECVSCGNETVKDQMVMCIVGDVESRSSYSHAHHFEYKPFSYEEGYLCEYCSEEPAQYPKLEQPSIMYAVVIFSFVLGLGIGTILL